MFSRTVKLPLLVNVLWVKGITHLYHFHDWNSGIVGHEAEDGEDDEATVEGGQSWKNHPR